MQFPIFLSIQNKNIIYLYIYNYIIIDTLGFFVHDLVELLDMNSHQFYWWIYFFRPAEWFPQRRDTKAFL